MGIIFTIVILGFGIIITISLFYNNSPNLDKISIATEVDKFYLELDQICKNPFRTTNIFLNSNKNFKFYLTEDAVCAINEGEDHIYCQKTMCENIEKTIFEVGEFEREILCEVERVENKLNLSCQ